MSSSTNTAPNATQIRQRQDPMYHCATCPTGRGNIFDRLVSSARREAKSSFENHVRQKHPEHTGDFKDLLRPTTYRVRSYTYTPRATSNKAVTKGPLAPSVSKFKKSTKKPAKKTAMGNLRKPLAAKVERPMPELQDTSSDQDLDNDDEETEDGEASR